MAKRNQRRGRRRTRSTKIDHGDGRHPSRGRWRECTGRSRGTLPEYVRTRVPPARTYLWRERLVLQLRAKHGGDNPAGYRVPRRTLAQRRCATLLGSRWRLEQRDRRVAGHGRAGTRNETAYGTAGNLYPAARGAARCCSWAVVARCAVWGEAGAGA